MPGRSVSPRRSTIHLELFVTPRSRRPEVRRRLGAVYRLARPTTEKFGGDGPWVFRINSKMNSKSIPVDARLKRILGVKPSEDLWVEVAFYVGPREMRETIHKIWTTRGFKQVADSSEKLNVRRVGLWSADVGQLLAA